MRGRSEPWLVRGSSVERATLIEKGRGRASAAPILNAVTPKSSRSGARPSARTNQDRLHINGGEFPPAEHEEAHYAQRRTPVMGTTNRVVDITRCFRTPVGSGVVQVEVL